MAAVVFRQGIVEVMPFIFVGIISKNLQYLYVMISWQKENESGRTQQNTPSLQGKKPVTML